MLDQFKTFDMKSSLKSLMQNLDQDWTYLNYGLLVLDLVKKQSHAYTVYSKIVFPAFPAIMWL